MAISNRVSPIFPKRTVFNRSSEHKFNCDMGYLIPIEIQTMYPGDKVKLSMNALLRTTPLVVPPMHEIEAYCQAYFVAYRALDENFDDFISGGKDGQNAYELPKMTPSGLGTSGSNSVAYLNTPRKYSAWDYLGFPMKPFVKNGSIINDASLGRVNNAIFNFDDAKDNVPVMKYPFMAIDNIWNEYYRNQDLEDEIELGSSAYGKCNRVHWNRDYFTNSLPFQQRGISPALPLYGNLTGNLTNAMANFSRPDISTNLSDWNISTSDSTYQTATINRGSSTSLTSEVPIDSHNLVTRSNPLLFDFGKFSVYGRSTGQGSGSVSASYKKDVKLPVDGQVQIDNSLTAGTISEFRTAFQIQLWQERNARAGVRYTEFIQSHFGIHPTDERLDRPEYIGGCKFPVLTSEVIQTSESTSNSPQGTLAGRGLGVSSQYIGTYAAKEYGVMVVFFYIKPKSNYSSQGVNRQWQAQSRFDFYSPEFAHLSMQGIKNSELYVDTDGKNNEIFGYTGIYDELRTNYTTVAGDFRPDVGISPYAKWTLARSFSARPTLSKEFIQCAPDKRIFAVTDDSEPGFLCDVGINQQWLRPLPKYADPGFIDHSYY